MSEDQQLNEMAGQAQRIREFVLSRFPLARQAGLSDDDSLLESGIVDSLGILELVDFLTSEFDISIADDDLTPENFDSIRSLIGFVKDKLS